VFRLEFGRNGVDDEGLLMMKNWNPKMSFFVKDRRKRTVTRRGRRKIRERKKEDN